MQLEQVQLEYQRSKQDVEAMKEVRNSYTLYVVASFQDHSHTYMYVHTRHNCHCTIYFSGEQRVAITKRAPRA